MRHVIKIKTRSRTRRGGTFLLLIAFLSHALSFPSLALRRVGKTRLLAIYHQVRPSTYIVHTPDIYIHIRSTPQLPRSVSVSASTYPRRRSSTIFHPQSPTSSHPEERNRCFHNPRFAELIILIPKRRFVLFLGSRGLRVGS